ALASVYLLKPTVILTFFIVNTVFVLGASKYSIHAGID
ncbi:MAG: hypothetical protein RL708_1780, partial [Bacteroidota bacterium]